VKLKKWKLAAESLAVVFAAHLLGYWSGEASARKMAGLSFVYDGIFSMGTVIYLVCLLSRNGGSQNVTGTDSSESPDSIAKKEGAE
jgi:hypothetical protein